MIESDQLSRAEQLEQKRSYWRRHIESWRSSGMTQKDYCRQHDLKAHRFTYWKKRFVQTDTGVTFVPVNIRSGLPSSGRCPLRLVVDRGLEIEIGADFDPRVLRRLVTTLRSLP